MKALLFIFVLAIALPACKVNYSFTGGSTGDAKTLQVKFFQKSAALGPASLGQTFSEALKDKFTSQTSLSLSNANADLVLEGSITGYNTEPLSIQAGETAAQSRLTVTVSVKFTNLKNEKQNFDQTFSRYSDFASSQSLAAVENELIKAINDQLVDDIFNKALVNW